MDLPMLVLPTPGGPTSSTMEPAISPLKAPTAKLEDAVLDVVESGVMLVEHLARALEVELVLAVDPQGRAVAQSR